MALLKSAEKYSNTKLEVACKLALSFTTTPSLKSIQSILRSGQDKPTEEPEPARPSPYSFTRGAEYYKRRDD